MHIVSVLVLDGVVPLDLGIACSVFAPVRLGDGSAAYEVRVCGHGREVQAGPFQIRATAGLEGLAGADTIIVPGVHDPLLPVAPPALRALVDASARGTRIASICSGAFVLAAAGLLDGRRATTHWIGTAELARRYPAVHVDPDVLFVDEGNVITSAGAAAGLDMCLHMIRRDHGQAAAAHAARVAVVPLNRDGGQAPFIRNALPGSDDTLGPLLAWIGEHLHEPLDVQTLAARADLTPRTFARRFRDQTGTTPVQWLLSARVRAAQEMLERTSNTIEEIAMAAGFDSPITFRARFQKVVGVSPGAYRRRFSGGHASDR